MENTLGKIKLILLLLITSISTISYGQYLNIADGKYISNSLGDEIFPQWSSDGNSILYQSIINDKSSICIYDFVDDTTLNISNVNYNFNNPIWHPDGDRIVFDSDKNGVEYLYAFDLKTHSVKPLFSRKIRCRNASFSTSSRQVYFTGYDELNNSWEIYSYDFVYDNLNKLTNYKLGCNNPQISNNGKLIAYCKENPFKGTKNIDIINWYGEPVISFSEFAANSPTWNNTGFKLYFISEKDDENGELYSIWKDGTHIERLTNDTIKIRDLSISPNGTKMAISVLNNNNWDVMIIDIADE